MMMIRDKRIKTQRQRGETQLYNTHREWATEDLLFLRNNIITWRLESGTNRG